MEGNQLEPILKKVENDDHRKQIEEYIYTRERIDRVSLSSIRLDVLALHHLSQYLKQKPYDKATQQDIIQWEIHLEKGHVKKTTKQIKKSTVNMYLIHIKRFYKYLSDKTEYMKGKRFQKNIPYPNNVSWISSSQGNNHNELPLESILTHKQLLAMLDACDNIRDQAIIISLVDGGFRNGELISLNIESLGFDKLGPFFLLPKHSNTKLKTGQRKIRLFLVPSSRQYLREYLNSHPFKKYKKAPLFYSRFPYNYTRTISKMNREDLNEDDLEKVRMHRSSINAIVKTSGHRANAPINKPHDLRHVSATWCSKAGLNEMEMRIRFGWSFTSQMPSKYVHLAQSDLDDKIKILTGFKEPDEKEDTILQPVICINCDYENQPTNVVCGRCGTKLDITKEELTMTAVETGLSVQEMMKDPEFMMKMMNMMAEQWERLHQEKNKQKTA